MRIFWTCYFIITSIIVALVLENSGYYLIGRIKEWQTLVAGIVALLGALLTVRAIHAQITQFERSESVRRENRRIAINASLSFSLSIICEYSKNCINSLVHDLRELSKSDPDFQNGCCDLNSIRPLPDVPSGILPSLQEAIEFAPHHVKNDLSSLCQHLQIASARVKRISIDQSDVIHIFSFEDALEDFVGLYDKSSSLFEYARSCNFIETRIDKERTVFILKNIFGLSPHDTRKLPRFHTNKEN